MPDLSKSSAIRFVPYHQIDGAPNIIVDGAAAPGTVITLSHWPKSGTPATFRRDTSAEIVYAYLDSPALHVKAEMASNNHFDEDGLVGLLALTQPSLGMKYRDLLIDAATAGDFGVYKSREAARIAFTIAAYADPATSPLAKDLFHLPYLDMAGRLYEALLEIFPSFLTKLNDFKSLWEMEDAKLTASEELIENGDITIEERPELDLALINIPAGLPLMTVHRFTQVRLTECHPLAINTRTRCCRLLSAMGQHIEFGYRYETWVQFSSRRPPARVDLHGLAGELNEEETSEGRWTFDGVDKITPRLHLEGSAITSIPFATILKNLERHLSTDPPAWNPYD